VGWRKARCDRRISFGLGGLDLSGLSCIPVILERMLSSSDEIAQSSHVCGLVEMFDAYCKSTFLCWRHCGAQSLGGGTTKSLLCSTRFSADHELVQFKHSVFPATKFVFPFQCSAENSEQGDGHWQVLFV